MKLAFVLSSVFLVGLPQSAFAEILLQNAEERTARQPDATDDASKDGRPQPPKHLAKIKRIDEADADGIVWGETQNGLAIGIGKVATSLESPLRPVIEVYLENRGKKPITQQILHRTRFKLKLNGRRHDGLGFANRVRFTESLAPGQRHGPVKLRSDQTRMINALRIGPLLNRNFAGPELSEGTHTLQVDYVPLGIPRNSTAIASAAVKLEVTMSPYPVEKAVQTIRNGLQAENPEGRRNSAILAGQLGLSACRDDLIRVLNDEDTILRKHAARSLGNLRDPAAVEPLKQLIDDTDIDLRLQAVRSLTELGVPLEPSWIEPIIKSKQVQQFQVAVFLARNELGKKAVPMLTRCLDFDDPSVSNFYNYVLVQQISACGGPKHTYYHREKGTPEQIANNQRVLLDLKATVIGDL